MKTLQINPNNHDIIISADEINTDEKWANVSVQLSLGQESATGCINSQEAKKIGQWFLKLSEELK